MSTDSRTGVHGASLDASARAPVERSISIGLCMSAAFAIAALLVMLNIGRAVLVYEFGFNDLQLVLRKFDLDAENSIPAWFSSTMLASGGLLALTIGMVERQGKGPNWAMWAMLGLIFLGLSMDETAGFHELSGRFLKKRTDWHGPFYYRWVFVGAVFASVVGLAYLRFFLSLEPRTRVRLLIAGGVYIFGALGMEMVGAVREQMTGTRADLVYSLLVSVEEACEMAGAILFVGALLDYLLHLPGKISFVLDR